jgi:hypothetical protein
MRSIQACGRKLLPVLILFSLIAVGMPRVAEAEPEAEPTTEETVSRSIDAALLRPMGFIRMLVGGALLVPVMAMNTLGLPVSQDMTVYQDSLDTFIYAPYRYTFTRPLGEDLAGG